MNGGGKIGHFNLIVVDRLAMADKARIGHFNRIRGNFSLIMAERAWMGNKHIIAGGGRRYEPCTLRMDERSHLTGGHLINMTSSVRIGRFTTIAGGGTQIWTHSYFHTDDDRAIRVDGEVNIGACCYIGSGSIIMPGVSITDHVIVGAGSNIAKSLTKPGLYVSQPLRFIEYNVEQALSKVGEEVMPGVYKKE